MFLSSDRLAGERGPRVKRVIPTQPTFGSGAARPEGGAPEAREAPDPVLFSFSRPPVSPLRALALRSIQGSVVSIRRREDLNRKSRASRAPRAAAERGACD